MPPPAPNTEIDFDTADQGNYSPLAPASIEWPGTFMRVVDAFHGDTFVVTPKVDTSSFGVIRQVTVDALEATTYRHRFYVAFTEPVAVPLFDLPWQTRTPFGWQPRNLLDGSIYTEGLTVAEMALVSDWPTASGTLRFAIRISRV